MLIEQSKKESNNGRTDAVANRQCRTGSRTQREGFIHQTPTPTWLSNRVRESYSGVKDKIEPFGTLVSTRLLYDVERWLRRIGFE